MLIPFSRSRRRCFSGRIKSLPMRRGRGTVETTPVTLRVLVIAILGANAAQAHVEVLAGAIFTVGEERGELALLDMEFHDSGSCGGSNVVTFQYFAQANTVVNGRNFTRVRFGRKGKALGFYRQTGPRQWQEIPAASGGRRFSFTETNCDDWSV